MADQRINQCFGNNLASYRKEHDISRVKLSSMCELPVSTIQGYELARYGPSLTHFLQLCNRLAVSPNLLLSGLLPEHTEQDQILELETLLDSLSEQRRGRIEYVLDLVIPSLADALPRLDGENIGRRISVLRGSLGYNVSKLAEACLIAKPTLQGYEAGQLTPSLATLLRFCEVFEVSPEYLLAPQLTKLSCRDTRFMNLRPKQISACVKVAQYLTNKL